MNTRGIRFEPEAEADLEEAARWYARENAELSARQFAETESVLDRLAAGDHGVPVPGVPSELGSRRLPLPGFPLWLVFVERGDQVLVVAVAHERRRPDFWLLRTKP